MKKLILSLPLLGICLGVTGCAGLLGTAAGGAVGGLAGDKLGGGDTAAIVLGSAAGAGIGYAITEELQKKSARDKARAFEEGRRYEREVAAQNEWFKATLEPEDPNWVPSNSGGARTSRQVKTQAPSASVGGMRFNEHVETESVLP